MSQVGWTTVHVRRPSDAAEVARVLFGFGAEAVQELDDALLTHVRDLDTERARVALEAVGARDVSFAPLPAHDWTQEWRARVSPHRVGRLVVTPPWRADEFSPADRIVIEPAMAFGTGEHETTRGVMRLMAKVIRAGDMVADLGAGSAVLSIAAARLGAARVTAIEMDGDAIGNAELNVATNGVQDRVAVIQGDAALLLPLIAPVRVVLANIITPILRALLPTVADALADDGIAILSGILVDERPAFLAGLGSAGWRVVAGDEEGAWWSVAVERA